LIDRMLDYCFWISVRWRIEDQQPRHPILLATRNNADAISGDVAEDDWLGAESIGN
jgi:hypothetical protein